MPLTTVDLALIAAMFAGILSLAGLWVKYRTLPKEKLAIQRTIGLGIGTFMQNLSKQAAEEEGNPSSPGSGALNLGGFKIDAATLRSVAEIMKLLKEFGGVGGLLGGLTGGGGGGGKIGL